MSDRQMRPSIDETHDVEAVSWVRSAADHPDFPIQNLPLGVFTRGADTPRIGVAIGDCVLDLRAVADAGLFDHHPAIAAALHEPSLNSLMALGAEARRQVRSRSFSLLRADSSEADRVQRAIGDFLHPLPECTMLLPARVGDFTDFYAGIHHAYKGGTLFRPEAPLPRNYKYVPIAYHGRVSTIRPSPADVVRPHGQVPDEETSIPRLIATRKLDYELELGIWIGAGGEVIAIGDAGEAIFGYTLLNDWSARDIQRWEAAPLGPFLAKNFATRVSPWIVTPEALAPFRQPPSPRSVGDPAPLPYLDAADDRAWGAVSIDLEAWITTAQMRASGLPAERLSRASTLDLYWTPAQMVTHHSVNGCRLEPADLLGSGTISAAHGRNGGCLMELSEDGRSPLALASGEVRSYLEDGDQIVLRGRCIADGFRQIGFGECTATVLPALHHVLAEQGSIPA